MTGSRRQGDEYPLEPDEIEQFRREGYVHLRGVLSAEEVAGIEEVYDRFLRREIPVEGRDFCDMSGDYDRDPDDFSIVNVMLPRRYHPEWRDNVYERRAASIARQLCGEGMVIDYDQLLAKRPFKDDAVFAWHQDMAYWIDTPDTRTASFWLAIDDSTVENGCLHFVPGSHLEPALRPHAPLLGDRDESHTLCAQLAPDDVPRPVPLARGDVTVHHERTLHGSPGNRTASQRRGYVVAFRAAETVAEERRRGFTHSHNDAPETLDSVGIEGETKR